MFASMEEQVILVDEKDNPIGLMGKMEAHEKAILHRASLSFPFWLEVLCSPSALAIASGWRRQSKLLFSPAQWMKWAGRVISIWSE